jgi:putative transposase
VRYAFIQEHRKRCSDSSGTVGRWPVSVMCRTLRVMRSGFYSWRKRKPSARQVNQQKLLEKIRRIYQEHDGRYGSPRVCHALLIDGQMVCRNTVAKLMRQGKIRANTRRRFVPCTTDSAHNKPVADNLLDRDFAASAPNQKWLADITYVDTDEGWLFLAAVLDCFSRRIVGWAMSDAMPADLVSDALKMALLHRQPSGDLLHHSDRGSQYASDEFQGLLARQAITCSMSGRGNCYDNAMMESFWATLKVELIHQRHYCTHEQARRSIFEYIEVYYNRKRLHSSLGYLSPESFEAA